MASGLEAKPVAVVDMLAGLVVHKDAVDGAAAYRAMAQRVGAQAGAAQASALGGNRRCADVQGQRSK